MTNINLKKIRSVLYLLTSLAFIVQLILSKTQTDFICVLLLLLSNLIVISYCFNDKYFIYYPISLNTIFFSYIISYGGALYLNTLELTHINTKLIHPKELIFFLSYFWFLILATHFVYRKFYLLRNLKEKLSNVLFNLNLMQITNQKFLFTLTYIGYGSFVLQLLYVELVPEWKDRNILFDILRGANIFMISPLIIIFSNNFYNIKNDFPKAFTIIICLLILTLGSVATNIRAGIFDLLFIFGFLLFINFQLFKKYETKNFYLKIAILLILVVPITQFIELVSLNVLKGRAGRYEAGKIANLQKFSDFSFKELEEFKKDQYLNKTDLTSWVYENTTFNRLNHIYIHDQFLLVSEAMNKNDIKEVKNFEMGRAIASLPQPIINIFSSKFNKEDYLSFSIGSLLQNKYDPVYGLAMSIGSIPIFFKLYFGNFFPIYLFIVSLFIFSLGDAFHSYKNKKHLISPTFFLCCLGSGGGILDIYTTSSLAGMAYIMFREIPQTILIYFVLLQIFNFFTKVKN